MNDDKYRAEPRGIPTAYHRAKRPGMYPSVPVESGDTTSYREQVAEALNDATGFGSETWPEVSDVDNEYVLADAVLAVRDAEMERLREQLKQTGFERSYWRDLIAERRLDVLRGLAKRLTLMRRNYVEASAAAERAQNQFLDTYNSASSNVDRVRELETALRERTDQRNEGAAERAQMLADFQANDESNLADNQALADENERLRAELRQAFDEYAEETVELRAELADLRERAAILPLNWRTTIRSLPSNYPPSHWGADEERWAYKEALRDVTELITSFASWRPTSEPAEPAKATEDRDELITAAAMSIRSTPEFLSAATFGIPDIGTGLRYSENWVRLAFAYFDNAPEENPDV